MPSGPDSVAAAEAPVLDMQYPFYAMKMSDYLSLERLPVRVVG